MTVLEKNDPSSSLRGKKFNSFLDSLHKENDDYVLDLYDRRLSVADAVTMEVYHGLIWFMETYPSVKRVAPVWHPRVDADNNFLVSFGLNLTIERNGKEETDQYGYGEAVEVEGMEENSDQFDRMIETGEMVGPEIWNEFILSANNLLQKKEGFRSVDEVRQAMTDDIGEFVALFSAWNLENHTAPAVNKKKSHRL